MDSNIQSTLEKAQNQWIDMKGIVAISRGKKDDSDCIVIFVTNRQNDQVRKVIPSIFMDVPVDIRVAGTIQAEE